MKTYELTGAALDWAVAKCEGWIDDCNGWLYCATLPEVENGHYKPSTDWAQGGPIIERERIEVRYRVGVNLTASIDGKHEQSVPYRQPNAQLTVAMRCYVASKLGEEVEVPNELA
ncbi:MAG: phage protein NinX family protein [Betaproteobacteria bacterium]